jgi:hypothetical protein
MWINSSHCVMNVLDNIFLQIANPFSTIHVKIFPVFKPNEYFFEHYWDPKSGKEKWEPYAETIREIIAEGFDLQISDMSFNDKRDYIMKMKGVMSKSN